MKVPFKPHILALICSTAILAASGVLYVKSQTPPPAAPPEVAQPVEPPSAPAAVSAPPTFTTAQLDQWVAPVALYPDALLSQVLMAATYPANVMQAAQWSQDNPALKGDAAIQAVSNQPWDASVKSLVAFPQLMALLGENPAWVQNLGDAFLAQPKEVMDSVQKLRLLAQQTGSLKSTPQQTVTTTRPAVSQSAQKTLTSAPAPTVIKIEPADPQVVYVPNYNPAMVYGSWPNATYPPVYLPPPPGQQFTDSLVRGFGYSLGVATTYALFSNIDWDHDDDHHDHHDDGDHHDNDDYHHHDGYSHNGDNININVNNFNHITGANLPDNGNNVWHHNPAYRDGVPYHDANLAQKYHQTDVAGGLSATQHNAPNLDAQRQAASQQLQQITKRNNYRGYDSVSSDARRNAARAQLPPSTMQAQPRRDNAKTALNHATAQPRQAREPLSQHRTAGTPEQRQQRMQSARSSALSGNDSRSPSWQAQNQRGLQSLQHAGLNSEQRGAVREHLSEHRELRRH